MARIFRYTIAGMLGAIIAWAVMEPTSLMPDDERKLSYGVNFAIGLISGLVIGVALGIAEVLSGVSPKDAGKSILAGALMGAAGGVLGLSFGNAIYGAMEGLAGGRPSFQNLPENLPPGVSAGASAPSLLKFLLLLIGRGSGWALIGAFIGLSQGIATSSTRKMINGAVGGLLGGGIGGSVFEIFAWITRSGVAAIPPQMVRFICFSITGAAIGLFIGFVEEMTKKAWLVRLVGRNEGKEYMIYKPVTIIGRDESADIPIFQDPDVSERHASIISLTQRHMIEDMGSFYGTTVNGKKVSGKEPIRDGDTIEVGKTKFLFRDKATARFTSGSQGSYGGGVQIPTSEHLCPFCGSVKDAAGNCDCTVGSPGAAAPPVQQQTQALSQSGNQQTAQSGQTARMGPAPAPQVSPDPFGSAPQSPQPQGARLTAMSGPYAGQVFVLKSGQTEIGREATRDIGLPMDNTVSRNHARIAQEVTVFVLYDAGSTNGTFVNGQRVQRHDLTTGDIVQIGNTKFRFEM